MDLRALSYVGKGFMPAYRLGPGSEIEMNKIAYAKIISVYVPNQLMPRPPAKRVQMLAFDYQVWSKTDYKMISESSDWRMKSTDLVQPRED